MQLREVGTLILVKGVLNQVWELLFETFYSIFPFLVSQKKHQFWLVVFYCWIETSSQGWQLFSYYGGTHALLFMYRFPIEMIHRSVALCGY